MTWAKLDDHFHDHTKVIAAGHEAVGLFALCLTWASGHRSNGLIPNPVPKRFAGGRAGRLCASLVEAGLFEVDEQGWRIHDFLDYNPSRDTLEALESENHQSKVRAGRAGGIKSGIVRSKEARGKQNPSRDEADAKQDSSRGEAQGKQNEAPTRPVPTRPTSGTRKRAAQPAPDIFPITDLMAAWGRENAPLVSDPSAETAKFLDHHRARGSAFKDWVAAWRTWMANAQTYAAERAGRGIPVQGRPAPEPADRRRPWTG